MMNSKANRMDTLKANGVDTSKFFNLSMDVPVGSTVQIIVDGKPYVYNANSNGNGVAFNGVDATMLNGNKVNCGSDCNVGYNVVNDEIVKHILDNGYVFNSRVDGRWVTAQTFRMLNSPLGWNDYLNRNYSFMYQFDMMLDEVHRLAKMETNNDPEFAKLSRFFTKEVIIETCKHYMRQLKKYVKKLDVKKCKGVPYVRLPKYGNVFVKDLDSRVYFRLEAQIKMMEQLKSYKGLEFYLKTFVDLMVDLPYNTPKASCWKDAFKGKGAYVSLCNITKFHGVKVLAYETGKMLDTYDSVAYIEKCLDAYDGNYWKFHELLKATIDANNFDLRKSIESQKVK